MNNSQLQQFALQLIEKHKNEFEGNSNAQELINIIKNNDEAKGIEFANNFLKSNNMSKEQGLQQAMSYFGLKI